MSIKRILLLASMALAAIAFAAPAAAQANVFLTDPVNVKVGIGKEITATSTNLTTTTVKGGTLTCALVTLHLEVLANGPNHVELKQLGFATTTGCKANGVLPVTIQNGGVIGSKFTINTWGTSNATSTFISQVFSDAGHVTKVQECDYEGILHIVPKGASPTDTIEVTTSPLTAPNCDAATIKGDFTLETKDKTPVLLDYKAT